jgi:hypothetical protein
MKTEKFKFGDIIVNHHASEDNPHRKGVFVNYDKNTIVLTDMKGDFWFPLLDNDAILEKVGSVLLPLPQQEPEISAVKFLLDNNCGDLVLNEQRHKNEKVERIYASDIMIQYASQFKLLPVPSVTITDEMIEHWARELYLNGSYTNSFATLEKGMKMVRDNSQLPAKESIQSNSDKIKEKQGVSDEEIEKWAENLVPYWKTDPDYEIKYRNLIRGAKAMRDNKIKDMKTPEEILEQYYPIEIAETDGTLDYILKAMEVYHAQFEQSDLRSELIKFACRYDKYNLDKVRTVDEPKVLELMKKDHERSVDDYLKTKP